jgi:DnaK suppressor protein
MAAKKPSGKALRHKAAAPKKAVHKRAKSVKAKPAAHRLAASARKKAAPAKHVKPPKAPEKAQFQARVHEKVPERPKFPLQRPRGPVGATLLTPARPIAMPVAADADGSDEENASLLAGPRNVKPYIAKRGEEYMNKEQLEHFRLILNTWKRDLMEEVDRTVLHMKDEAANFPDPNDRATQESEFSLELRTRDRERKLIRKIDEALKRIEDGSYGYCLETGEEIGIKRLEARPVATLCVEAQERRERREKQYGDRDDRYR